MTGTGGFRFKRYQCLLPFFFLALCWLLVLFHNATFDDALRFLSRLGSVLLFSTSCIAVGSLFVSIQETSARILISFTTGLAVLYYVVFFLASVHASFPLVLAMLFYLPCAAWLVFHARPSAILGFLTDSVEFEFTQIGLLLIAAFVLFYTFIISLNPVTHYDALANHLGIAAEYLNRGGIESIPYNLHANLPPAAHMINMLLIEGAGADALQTFNWALLIFLALAFRCMAGADSMAWLYGIVCFALIPQVSLLFSLANIESPTTLFCMASLLLLFRRFDGKTDGSLLSLHLAFLLSLKYQAGVFIVLVFVALVFRIGLKTAPILGAFLALVSPFLVKNAYYVGDPVFPFGAEYFRLPVEAIVQAHGFISANTQIPSDAGVGNYVRACVECFTRLPESGLLLLVAGVSAFCYRRIGFRHKGYLALFSTVPVAMHSIVSLNVVNLMRWTQYSWACLCLLGGLALESLRSRKTAVLAGFAVYCIVSFYMCFDLNMRLTESFQVGIGKVSDDQYRSRFIPSYDLRMKLVGLDEKVLFIGEGRGYYNVENSTIPSDYNSLYLQRYFSGARSAAELRANFQRDGIRYLFINTQGIQTNIQRGRLSWLAGEKLGLLQELVAESSTIGRDGISLIVQL